MSDPILDPLIALAAAELDPARAFANVRQLCTWNRLPGSADYHRAVEWAAGELESAGIETTRLAHSTDGQRDYWGYITPPAWECRSGTLDLLLSGGARRVADHGAEPLSVIQRSVSTPGIVEAEVVLIDEPSRPDAYGESRGKVILSSGSVEDLSEYGIRRSGALGLIVDGMAVERYIRPEGSLPDAMQWASFQYYRGRAPEGWGFAISPRQGQELRQLLGGGPVRIRAAIESKSGEGLLEGVDAFLPGETEEEIWLIAHLCHPAPFANDNASGAGLLLEIARTLSRVVALGRIRLKRGIRFLFPVEIAGTVAWLSERSARAPRAVAGLNLDMVGERQDATGSTLCIDRPPDACPSALPELIEAIYDASAPASSGLSDMTHYPHHRQATTSFSAGSDHWILGDPGIGVPTPMLIEWPDRYYHTTADRLEMVDPDTLRRNGISAAAYALFLATAGAADARWLQQQTLFRSVESLSRMRRRPDDASDSPPLEHRLRFRVERQKEALRWTARLAGESTAEEAGDRVLEIAATALGAAADEGMPDRAVRVCGGWVLQRVHPAPLSPFPYLAALNPGEWDEYRRMNRAHGWAAKTYYRRLTHWIDGKRTVDQIAYQLTLNVGRRDIEYLAYLIPLLVKLGLLVTVGTPTTPPRAE